ncbi:MAG: hypothetical protein IKG08_03985 [Eubacterium sp.]|nr:hypothetical protein [Eubacterium sp.]
MKLLSKTRNSCKRVEDSKKKQGMISALNGQKGSEGRTLEEKQDKTSALPADFGCQGRKPLKKPPAGFCRGRIFASEGSFFL